MRRVLLHKIDVLPVIRVTGRQLWAHMRCGRRQRSECAPDCLPNKLGFQWCVSPDLIQGAFPSPWNLAHRTGSEA